MKKKFKIYYSDNHGDKEVRGKEYSPRSRKIKILMDVKGCFFISTPHGLKLLGDEIGKFRVEWL